MHLNPQGRLSRLESVSRALLVGRIGGDSDPSEDCGLQMLDSIQVRSSASILDGLVKLE